MIERFHHRLKDSLRARLASSDWYEHLPWVLLGLRSTPREDSATSASEAVYGSELVLPNQFSSTSSDPSSNRFFENLRSSMSGFRPVPVRHNIPPSTNLPEQLPSSLRTCPMVFVRKDSHIPPLSPLYEGPYKVLERNLRTFRLQIGSRTDTVSTTRLKPAFTKDDELPALPPRRGRPPHQDPAVLPPPLALKAAQEKLRRRLRLNLFSIVLKEIQPRLQLLRLDKVLAIRLQFPPPKLRHSNL